jgi:hypothetical protein
MDNMDIREELRMMPVYTESVFSGIMIKSLATGEPDDTRIWNALMAFRVETDE